MKTLRRSLLGTIIVLVFVAAAVYVDGAMLPVNHLATITDVVDAPPAEVFALITGVAEVPSWRKSVGEVTLLPEVDGHERWIEAVDAGEKMTFTAIRTEPVDAHGVGRRDVLLNDPDAEFGGTWTYMLAEGASPNQTQLSITEAGFVHPPVYRFMMRHVFGTTANLNQYMDDLKAATGRR